MLLICLINEKQSFFFRGTYLMSSIELLESKGVKRVKYAQKTKHLFYGTI